METREAGAFPAAQDGEPTARSSRRAPIVGQMGNLCEWTFDARTGLFQFDALAAQCFGWEYGRQEVPLQAFAELAPADERHALTDAFQRQHLAPSRVRATHRLWNALDARWMALQTIGYPTPDGRLAGFSQDISTSRENEDTLRRYRNLLVTSGVFGKICYWTLDYSNRVYQIGDDLAEQIGWPLGVTRIPEADYSGRIHPGDIAQVVATRRAATSDDTPTNLEYRLWKATEQRWIYVRSALFFERDPRGKPVMMYGFTQDVTAQKEAEAQLRRERQRIKSAQLLGRMATWGIDLSAPLPGAGAGMLRMSGIRREGDVLTSVEEFVQQVHAEDRQNVLKAVDHSCETYEPLECEFRRWHATERRWSHMKAVAQVAYDVKGNPYELQGFAQDITRQKESEERLLSAASVFEHSRSLIVITDVNRRVIQVNPAFCELSGYAEHEVIGRSLNELGHLELPERVRQRGILRALARKQHWSGELRAAGKHGQCLLLAISISVVRDEQGEVAHFIYVGEDITQQKAAEARINQLAYYDTLTNLPNRALLREHADAALSDAQRRKGEVALIFLDLDHFKNVNDSLGHAAGDQLLMEMAHRLQTSVCSTDTVGRLGGDEFMIVMPRAGIVSARRVAEQLTETISQPIVLEGITVTATASVGIAVYPQHGDSYADLMRAADAAMYRAKGEGRGTVVDFIPSMNDKALTRLMLTNELRQAVQERRLQLYYQPQVSMRDGRLLGVEALLRWPHPTRGMISPAEFIPIAEESGTIEPLGAWVIWQACRQAVAWSARGLPALSVSVNCSARQFVAPLALLDTVRRALAETGLPAGQLELEITESMIVQDVTKMQWLLEQFRALGVRIAIDDFGTGYSSLAYLKRLPLDKLKIDRSFVHDIETDPDDLTIAATIANLGRSLGLKVTAEGVETQQQLHLLQTMQCDEGQGYFWGKPMPAEQFVDWVRTRYPDSKRTA